MVWLRLAAGVASTLSGNLLAHPNCPPDSSRCQSQRWDSNPRPTVYKTVALPLSYAGSMQKNSLSPGGIRRSHPIRGPGPLPAVVTRSNPVAIVADYCSLGREGFEPP